MKVLVACEESQRVCTAFRERGHEAYSCDIQEPSGGHPEWHILGDVLEVLNPKFYKDIHGFVEFGIQFDTMDDVQHIVKRWDLIIAHPPCTYLTNVATRHHSIKFTPLDKINRRTEKRIESMSFFMRFVNADCDKIAIENPVGVMNTCYRKPDQIIHPYMFAESEDDTDNYVTKATCLWLKNLPPPCYKFSTKTEQQRNFRGHAVRQSENMGRQCKQKRRRRKSKKQNLLRCCPCNGFPMV